MVIHKFKFGYFSSTFINTSINLSRRWIQIFISNIDIKSLFPKMYKVIEENEDLFD